MRFDACAKVGPSYKGTSFMIEDYGRKMEQNGISKALIAAEKPLSYDISDANDYIERILNEDDGRFLGAVRINPWDEKQAHRELAERFKNPKFAAVYLNPWEETFQINRDVVKPVLDFAQKENKPVIIEAGYVWASHVAQVADIAAEYPDVKFLMLNAGQMDLSGYTLTDVKHFMGKTPNLYLGTNGAVAADWLVDIYRNVSPGKVVFCSNYPFFEVDLECRRIELGFFTEDEKKDIFCTNGMTLFNL